MLIFIYEICCVDVPENLELETYLFVYPYTRYFYNSYPITKQSFLNEKQNTTAKYDTKLGREIFFENTVSKKFERNLTA